MKLSGIEMLGTYPRAGIHETNISIPDSFMYIPAMGYVPNISIPDSFMYIPAMGYVPNISRNGI